MTAALAERLAKFGLHLVLMKMQTELAQPFRQGRRHCLRILSPLEHQQIVVGVPDQPNVAGRVPLDHRGLMANALHEGSSTTVIGQT